MKTAGESNDGAFCRRVIKEIWPTDICIDATLVDDRRAWLQMGKSVLGEIKVRVDVGIKGPVPLFSANQVSGIDVQSMRCLTRRAQRCL